MGVVGGLFSRLLPLVDVVGATLAHRLITGRKQRETRTGMRVGKMSMNPRLQIESCMRTVSGARGGSVRVEGGTTGRVEGARGDMTRGSAGGLGV